MNRNALAGLGTMAMFTIACTVLVAVIAAWDSIKIVSPFIIYSVGGLFVSLSVAVSIWALTKAFKPLVDAAMEWTMKAFQIRAMNALINDPNSFVNNAGGIGAAALPTAKVVEPAKLPESIPATAIERPQLIPTIANMDCILFVGPRGRGKTTNMLRLIEVRRHFEIAKVFDTHAEPNKWLDAPVIGSELGLSEEQRLSLIWGEMMKIVAEMNSRLDIHRSTPGATFEPQTIYIDEFTDLPMMMKNTLGVDMGQQFTQPILNGGRKVKINFIWGSHSDRASALGMSGRYDLIRSFDAVAKLHKTQMPEEDRWAICDFGDGYIKDQKFQLGDPYPDGVVIQSSVVGEYTNTDAPPVITIPANATPMDVSRPRPRGKPQTICQMYAEGASFNQIAKTVYGSTGGKQTRRIQEILSAYGRLT